MSKIVFGTDGWRAGIAAEYTFDAVRVCSEAVAQWVVKNGGADRGVIVGYDRRFRSEHFAAAAAEVVAAHFRPIAETLVTNAGVTPSQATTLLHKMQQRANALHLHVRVSTMDVTVIKITSLASSLASRFALTGSLFQKA